MRTRPLIAIINDDPAFLEFLSSFLEEETDYDTVVWDDGVDTLPRLREHQPDAVILDVRLGDQAVGREILTRMRDDDDLRHLPVIICTADTQFLRENAQVLAALRADALEKPFDLEVLEHKVHAALGQAARPQSEPGPVG